jgi:alcohol/geraniol dehydrogenase (NADP+)
MVKGMMADKAGAELVPFEFDLGPIGGEQVEIAVESCGICHSDLSIIDNEWGISRYPVVPGHEVVGRVVAVGASAKNLKVGDRVGLGWYSGSCMSCRHCLGGHQNLCGGSEATMLGRYGGWATRVRSHWAWAVPLPVGVEPASAGPLFCGGITVFNPLVQFGVKPTDRVGVIGIGGLGHLALQFLRKWGCEVIAFTSSDAKSAEAIAMGAHQTINSRDSAALGRISGSVNFLLNTANADLDWNAMLNVLAPGGRLHVVGVTPSPIPVPSFKLIASQAQVSGTPLGSPANCATMLDFVARHDIRPVIETFKMSNVNAALAHLRDGKARYRIVLENDLDS